MANTPTAALKALKTELETRLEAVNTLLGVGPSRVANVAPGASRGPQKGKKNRKVAGRWGRVRSLHKRGLIKEPSLKALKQYEAKHK